MSKEKPIPDLCGALLASLKENPVRLELPEPTREEMIERQRQFEDAVHTAEPGALFEKVLLKHPCSGLSQQIERMKRDLKEWECGAKAVTVRPALEKLFATELDAMEQLLAANLGPNGELVREEKSEEHHINKARSHTERGVVRIGPFGAFSGEPDEDSGLHHYIHAATRLLFALRALRMAEATK